MFFHYYFSCLSFSSFTFDSIFSTNPQNPVQVRESSFHNGKSRPSEIKKTITDKTNLSL